MSTLNEAVQGLSAALQDRQQNRILRMHFPREDGPDAVMVANGLDAIEALSRDFAIQVEVLCDDARLELKDVQGKMVTIELVREDGSLRYFNGYVFEFKLVKTDGAQAFYSMLLRPWMSYLALRKDNFLFHGRSVYQQTDDICRDYVVSDWQIDVLGEDEPMTDACQFDETDYNYLHRRWEAMGWHYWYEHRKDGHTLVLSDNSFHAEPIDGETCEIPWQSEAGSMEDDAISEWKPVRRLVPAQVTLRSFDFKNPQPRMVDMPTLNDQGEVLDVEVYEYSGAYGFKDRADGERMARQRMEEIESRGKHFEAASNDRFAAPRRWFRLTGHFDQAMFGNDDAEREFLIFHVRHLVSNNYLQNAKAPAHYENVFACIRKKIPWRPGLGFNSKKTQAFGLQTALVVGPKGEEIHTDKYGRIRVQFHWDREGTYDERSSAWIRVSQPWAGSGWGAVAIPRIGQEVVVQFLDGNPDRPLVTGSLFNAANMPPYALPGGDHMMGFKSHSTPGGGGHCEMVIHDAKGHELINIHSQKDMVTTVQHNDSTIVNGPQQTIAVTTGLQATTVHKSIQVVSETEHIQTTAHTAIEMVAQTKHIHLEAATDLVLVVGKSKLEMNADGSILIEGVNITIKGSAKVDTNP